MAVEVALRNEKTGEIKNLKVGWSWTLLLFGQFFGIPFWARKVYSQAILMVAWDILFVVVPESESGFRLVGSVVMGCALGFFGNKLTAQYYLKHDWAFVDPETEAAEYARQQWGLA